MAGTWSGLTLTEPVADRAQGAMFAASVEAAARLRLSERADLQLSARYAKQGTRFGAVRLVHESVSVPVLVRLRDPARAPVRPYLGLGPEVGVVVRAYQAFEADGVSQRTTTGQSVPLLDLAAVGVVGITLPAGNARLDLSLRASHGVVAHATVVGGALHRQVGAQLGLFL